MLFLVLFSVNLFGQEIEEDEEDSIAVSNVSWKLTARADYERSNFKDGLDLSGSNPTLNYFLSIKHSSGLSSSFLYSGFFEGEKKSLFWYADLQYDYSVSEWLDMSAGLSHTKYFVDSLNAVYDLENCISVSASASLNLIDLGLTYDLYLGSDPAHYLTLDVSRMFEIGDLTLLFSASAVYMTQRIEEGKLEGLALKLKHKSSSASANPKRKVSLSGINSYYFDLYSEYDLGSGFSAYFNPTYIISPKSEVSSKDKQLSWLLGVQYSFRF